MSKAKQMLANGEGDKTTRKYLALSYCNTGLIHWNQGDFAQALEYNLKRLKLQGELGDNIGIARSLNYVGLVHYSKGDYSTALEIYTKALRIREKIGDKVGIAKVYNNFGLVYYAKNEYQQALEYYIGAIRIYEELGMELPSAPVYNNMGEVYQVLGNYEKALEFCNEGLQIRVKYDIPPIYSYNNIAAIYLKQKRGMDARKILEKSAAIALNLDDKPALIEAYLPLARAGSMMKDFHKAYDNYKLYTAVKDSMFYEKSNRQLTEMQTKYDTEKKEEEINLLTVKQLAEQRDKRNAYLGIIIAILLAVALFGVQLYRRKYLQKSLVLKEIHYRINNNLQIISSLLSLHVRESKDERMRSMMNESQARIRSLSLLDKNLYVQDSIDRIKMKDYLEQLISFYVQALQSGGKQVEVELEYDDIFMSSKKAVPVGLLVNELVTNSYKYAFPGEHEQGKIRIVLQEADGMAMLKVSDNGKGGEQMVRAKVWDRN